MVADNGEVSVIGCCKGCHWVIACEGRQCSARREVPEPQGVVLGGRDGAVVWQRRDVGTVRMTFEDARALPGSEVPEPQGVVPRGRDGAVVRQRRDMGDGA